MNKGVQLLTTSVSIRWYFLIHNSLPLSTRFFSNLMICITFYQGNENALKKLSLTGPVLHPFLAYVQNIIICRDVSVQTGYTETYASADGNTLMF